VKHHWLLAVCAFVLLGVPAVASAQGDEIQVYDGGLAPVGVFNLTWHNNYTPDGIKTPEFPGAVTSNKSFNGVTEWAYGVTNWFEAGLYMPLYSHDDTLGWKVDGFKLRTLFAVPNGDTRKFVYGVNVEYSYNAKYWDNKRFTSEVRPIVAWHFDRANFIVNPIVDTRWDGLKNLEFVPSIRADYRVAPRWVAAVEEYADYGLVSDFGPGRPAGAPDFRRRRLLGRAGHRGWHRVRADRCFRSPAIQADRGPRSQSPAEAVRSNRPA
jgi:hypothetical protein